MVSGVVPLKFYKMKEIIFRNNPSLFCCLNHILDHSVFSVSSLVLGLCFSVQGSFHHFLRKKEKINNTCYLCHVAYDNSHDNAINGNSFTEDDAREKDKKQSVREKFLS